MTTQRINKEIIITLLLEHFMVNGKASVDALDWFGIDETEREFGLEDAKCEERDLKISLDGYIELGSHEIDIDTEDKTFPESMWKQLEEIAENNSFWR